MAKPIRATPTLFGKEAVDFVVAMRKREENTHISRINTELLKLMEENKKVFKV